MSDQLWKRWNRKIRQANLNDYNNWLEEITKKMEEEDKCDDSETIFRVIKIVSCLMVTSSSQASSVDKNGDLILDQAKWIKLWQAFFLEGKFKTTETEKEWDPYETLGPQLITDPLTE